MAAKGLSLIAIDGNCQYIFEETGIVEYSIKLELLENMPSHPESIRYIEFIEDTETEYLGSCFRWAYFRKKKIHGEFELYSEYVLRIKQLNHVLGILGIILFCNLLNCVYQFVNYIFISYLSVSLFSGIVNIIILLFIGFGLLNIHVKKRNLKKEQMLHE